MRKKLVSLSALLALLIISGCGQKASQMGQQNNPASPAGGTENTQKDSGSGIFSGSIKDLLAKGKNIQCTWSSGSDAAKVSGTIYMDGGKFFQEYTSIQPDKSEVKNYVLNDSEWIYQWSSSTKLGMKMQMAEIEKMAQNAKDQVPAEQGNNPAQAKENINTDLSAKSDYSCQDWTVDASKFQLPADVQFNDFSQMLNNVPFSGVQNPSDNCQMCNSLPADVKALCLKNCKK